MAQTAKEERFYSTLINANAQCKSHLISIVVGDVTSKPGYEQDGEILD